MPEPSRARRTRAHPSPGGLKELPQPTRKSRQGRKKPEANEVTFAPLPEPATSQQQDPPSASSRPSSRESQSESSQHIPESRSTSPPQQVLALPAPSPHNNDVDETSPKRVGSASKKRNHLSDKGDSPRPAKRSRTSILSRKITESPQHNDSSSDAGASPWRSLSVPSRDLTISRISNDDEDQNDDDEDIDPYRASPRSILRQRPFLTPKPKRPSPAKQPEKKNNTESQKPKPKMMTNDMKERERIYFKKFGRPMPVYNPNLNASRRRGVLALPPAPVEDDESEEDLGEEYMDGPSFTQLALTSWSRRPEALAKQRDEYDAAHPVPSKTNTPEKTRKTTPSRPSRNSPSSTSKAIEFIVTASRSTQEHILTRPDLIDTTRALIKWAERNKRPLPTPKQLEALLDNFADQEQARAASNSNEHLITPMPEETMESSIGSGAESSGNSSEVNAASQSQTPRPAQARPQESRRIWAGLTAVKDLMSTPFKFLGRNEPADATNQTSESAFSFRHEHKLPHITEFATPSHPASRKPAPQTERQGRVQTPPRRGVQTERRRRPEEPKRQPISFRGLLTPAEIAEIHRKQDREKRREAQANEAENADAEDPSTPSRRVGSKRKRLNGDGTTSQHTPGGSFRVPSSPEGSDDEDGGNCSSKQRNIIWPSYTYPSPRHYRYPLDPRPGPAGRSFWEKDISRKEWEEYTSANPYKDFIDPRWYREHYARTWGIPMHQVPKDNQLLQWHMYPTMMWDLFCKGPAKSYAQIPYPLDQLLYRLYDAEEAAAEEAGLPLFKGLREAESFEIDRWRGFDFSKFYDHGEPLPMGAKLERNELPFDQHKERMDNTFGHKFDTPNFDPFTIEPTDGFDHPPPNHFWMGKVRGPGSAKPRRTTLEYNVRKKPNLRHKIVVWDPNNPTPTIAERHALHAKDMEEYETGWTEERPQRQTLADMYKLRMERMIRQDEKQAERERAWLAGEIPFLEADENEKHKLPPGPPKTAKDNTSTTPSASKDTSESGPSPSDQTSSIPTATSDHQASVSDEEEEEARMLHESTPVTEERIIGAVVEQEKIGKPTDNIFNPITSYADRQPEVQIPKTFTPYESSSAKESDSASSSGPLEPKKWTQTPPPKPRPGNAQLPQQAQTSSSDPLKPQTPQVPSSTTDLLTPKTPNFPQLAQSQAERATAKALEHKPTKPSGLRNVVQMSPLNVDKGGKENESQGGHNGHAGKLIASMTPDQNVATIISAEVQDYVNSIPEADIVLMKLPAHFYENWPKRSEVEVATDKFFR